MTDHPIASPAHRHNLVAAAIVLLLVVSLILSYQVIALTKKSSILASEVIALESGLSAAESQLDYVTPLAENGNQWAHSHPW